MIVLEFRFRENFQAACRLLEAGGLTFEFETAREEWRPSLLWLFEEALASDDHRGALSLAQGFERKDRFQRRHASVLNLAVPQ